MLDSSQPWSLPLVVDLAWLYLFALVIALDDIGRIRLADPRIGLSQVVVGDERERREKDAIAAQLRSLFEAMPKRQQVPAVDVVPPYYEDLSDLVIRLWRRRSLAIDALRTLELATVAAANSVAVPSFVVTDFVEHSLGVKLASDVVRFIIRTCRLDRSLQGRFDDLTFEAGRNPFDSATADDSTMTSSEPKQGQIDLFSVEGRQEAGGR
jgi:hypothetical protein